MVSDSGGEKLLRTLR